MVSIMKSIILKFIILVSFFVISAKSQDISFVPHDTLLYATPGTEIIFLIDVTNLTTVEQTVFLVRTENILPAGWTSSLCFDLCFSSETDSIATTSTYGSTPLAPGETREVSLHVFSDMTIDSGYVQLQAGTFKNPNQRITVDFKAVTDPTIDVDDVSLVSTYALSQNYPNPFNPSTKINYSVGEPGFVQLKVYNVLGVEVATLINEQKIAGNYSANFNATKLSSGVYFYTITVNDFTQTRKMILEK